MSRGGLLVLLGLALGVLGEGLAAQDPVRTGAGGVPGPGPGGPLFLEVRGGTGSGQVEGSADGGERQGGRALGLWVGWQLHPQAGVGVGWSRGRFGCEGGLCAAAPVSFTAQGFEIGLEGSWRAARVRTGLLRRDVRASWTPGSGTPAFPPAPGSEPGILPAEARGGAGLGGFVEAGGAYPLTERLEAVGRLRYLRHGTRFPDDRSRAVAYGSAEVGLRVRLSPAPWR